MRATTIHSSGAAVSPVSASGVVKATGSGFHDGPATVERSAWRISRPQISQAVAS